MSKLDSFQGSCIIKQKLSVISVYNNRCLEDMVTESGMDKIKIRPLQFCSCIEQFGLFCLCIVIFLLRQAFVEADLRQSRPLSKQTFIKADLCRSRPSLKQTFVKADLRQSRPSSKQTFLEADLPRSRPSLTIHTFVNKKGSKNGLKLTHNLVSKLW